ncbi:MAG: hypothetical protein U0V49_14365 [Saprospiraceae bacterium]
MKNYFQYPAVLAATCLATAWLMPWWTIAIAAAAVSFLYHMSSIRAFATALVTISLCFGLACFFQNKRADSTTSIMIGELFMNIGVHKLYYISSLVAGITAGLGAWAGASIRKKPKHV